MDVRIGGQAVRCGGVSGLGGDGAERGWAIARVWLAVHRRETGGRGRAE